MALPNGYEKLAKDFDSFWLKFYKSSYLSPNFQRLPRCWNVKDRSRSLRLSHFALTVSFSSGFNERHDSNYSGQDAACVRSDASIPLTTGIYYFEITVLNKGTNACMSVGVSMKTSSLNKLPGSENNSFGYQMDGCVYHGSPTSSTKFGPRFSENDIIGCGVDFLSQSLFFTRNGIFLGKAFEGKVPVGAGTRLFPTIGLQGRGVRVTTNFGQQPFYFAFENHLKTERISREDKLIERTCKEDFAGIKIKELVSGYLVHHGYVATAKAFSYWSNLAASVHNSDVQVVQTPVSEETSNRSSLVSSSSETNVDMHQDVANKESNLPALQRRHSDSSCLAPANISCQLGNQLPGIASMLHRRRLRALCRRCQYGKAAATLNRLYPQVLERCPELLVQLRCRQLIEMMHRHAVRRGRSHASNSGSEYNDANSTTAPPKVQRVSGSLHVGSGCCVTSRQDKSPQDTSDSIQKVIENGTPLLSMDVDSEDLPKPSHTEDAQNVEQKGEADLKSNLLTDLDDDLEAGDLEDDEDDDGFGVDDDTGVCINTLLPPQNVKACQSNSLSCTPSGMDVDSEVLSAESKSKSTKDGFGAVSSNSEMNSDDEMRCLLRHVQFGRSLVNLVRQVRAKTGGLSLETERLLQQSVSLLAYPSPTSSDCPLRGLLDPVWRDTIASIINSAVLKAHDLPAQPALEHGLRALQRCFQDKNFVEAQTLGHFLLYHLTPAQIAKVDEEVAAIEASAQHQTGKRLRSSISQSNGDQTNEADGNTSSGSRNTEVNGHNTVRPRARRCRRRRQVDGTVSESQSSEHTDECNSSVEEVNKEEEEEDDDDEEEGGCDSEQDDEDFDNDDDDEDGGMAVPSRRPNTRSSAQTTSVGAQNDRDSSESRGSNGGSSGRVHSNNFSNIAILTPLGTVNTASPNVHLGRQTILTRYCPAFLLDSSRTRLGTAISTSSLPTPHRSPAFSRRLTTSTTSAQPPRSEEDCQFDSAFQGLLSVSYPQHAEFLAAMDDALKAYAGSLLTEDEQAFMPNPQNQHSREDPPSPTGGGACA